MNKFFERKPYHVKYGLRQLAEKFKMGISQSILTINIRRERWLCFVLMVFVIIIMSTVLLVEDMNTVDKYVSRGSRNIHYLLLLMPVLFILLTNKSKNTDENRLKRLRIYHHAIVGLVLTACSVIAVNNTLINQRHFAYIIAIFCIASWVILNPIERYIYFFTSYIIYFAGVVYFIAEPAAVLESVIFTLPLMVLALMISSINYSFYVNNYINSMVIQEKNDQLDKMYQMAEEMLRERTEQLSRIQETEQIRNAFFANISHELRTPLNLIFTSEQLLDKICQKGNLDSHAKEISRYNSIIKQNCYRLTRLIGNLIDITKIDADYFMPCFRNIDIVKVVEDIAMSVAEFIEDKAIKLIFDTEYEEKMLAADAYQIERIILNLLSNAVKFTPAGGEIYVSLSGKGDNVIIGVKDTGIGIPKAMKNHIFERFVQVDKTTTRSREGSGIGLSLVKALVQMHGGSIDLISEEGKGSEFIIELPVKVLPQDALEECACEYEDKAEKIKIEFSDIYN